MREISELHIEKINEMRWLCMDMSLGDAVRTVNWTAKNLSAVRCILYAVRKDMEDDNWIPDISLATAKCIDQIAQEYGVQLHLAENINKYKKSCELVSVESDCPFHEMECAHKAIHKVWFRKIYCNKCVYFKAGVEYAYKKPDIENINFAIEILTKNINFLYGLKERACVASEAPVISYQRNSAGHVYRVYDLDGYKPHCPADATEISKIINGEIIVSKATVHAKDPLSIYQLDYPVEEAIEFIENFIQRKEV